MPLRLTTLIAIVLGLGLSASGAFAQDDPTAPIQMDTLEVVAITPTGGTGVPISQIPTNVQSVSGDALQRYRPLDVTDGLGTRLGSIHLSNLGSNPFQPDVNYRGFRGSPLLGLPQGISVFLDGARVNETFGDIVNWDLIPQTAIAEVNLLPGSNPAFGLNTLGGAVALRTKSGFSAPGARLQGFGGNNARFSGEAEVGGRSGQLGYYAAGSAFQEDGWRDVSRSDVQKAFAKATWISDRTSIDVSGLYASSSLRGNGAVPVELLAQDRSAVFTFPDETSNDLGQFMLSGTHQLRPSIQISGTAFGRFTTTDTFNGDDSDYGACPSEVAVTGIGPGQTALCFGVEEDEEGEEEEAEDDPRQVFDQNGNPVLASGDVDSATQNTSKTTQRRFGMSLQAMWTSTVFRGSNRLIVGGSTNLGRADFNSRTELGRLTDARGTIGSGRLDLDSFVEVETRAQSGSAYFVNTFAPVPSLSVTVSGRYTSANVTLDDRLGTALNGNHTFNRFNPALGATYQLTDDATVFANLSRSNRAPTPVELTCADPDDPCRLPNGFQADPPLEQVIATTYSTGVRSMIRGMQGSVSVFRTVANNDIYFISAGPARNSGFFDNIGQTRRQGVEVMAQGDVSRVGWFAAYTYLDATFRDDLTVNSPNHLNADDGEIEVETGDRLPLTPRHIGKLGLDVAVTSRIGVSSTVVVQGEQVIRGDESNQLEPLDPFATVNLEANARVYRQMMLFAKVDNLLNAKYNTAGLLGEPDEVEAFEDFENPRFVTPGAPRLVRAGVSYTF
jgi:outer membrane receptor protein involved in Fe transport